MCFHSGPSLDSRISTLLGQAPPFQQLAASWFLFALFFALASFVFNSLRTLLQKHRGWGYPHPVFGLSPAVDEDSRRRPPKYRKPGGGTSHHPRHPPLPPSYARRGAPLPARLTLCP